VRRASRRGRTSPRSPAKKRCCRHGSLDGGASGLTCGGPILPRGARRSGSFSAHFARVEAPRPSRGGIIAIQSGTQAVGVASVVGGLKLINYVGLQGWRTCRVCGPCGVIYDLSGGAISRRERMHISEMLSHQAASPTARRGRRDQWVVGVERVQDD